MSLTTRAVNGAVNKQLLIIGFSTPVKGACSSCAAVNWCLIQGYNVLALKGLPSADLPRITWAQLLKDGRNAKSKHRLSQTGTIGGSTQQDQTLLHIMPGLLCSFGSPASAPGDASCSSHTVSMAAGASCELLPAFTFLEKHTRVCRDHG